MAFVISQGQVATVDRALYPAAPTVVLGTDVVQDYAQIWRSQPNVRTVVDFLARNIAQLPIQIFERITDTDRKRLNDHPLAALLKKPNHFTTRYRLIDTLVHDMGIYDNAFWVKIKPDDGAATGLARVDPRMMTPMGKSFLNPEEYLLRGNGGYLNIPAESVVHFRGYNPDNPRWGCSPIETLRRTLAEEYQAGIYREQLWRNGARVSGYLSRPIDAPPWDDKGKQRFREQWQAQYTGDGPRAGGTPILEDGMAFNQASVTPEQAQYLENRKLTREECAAAYHIPLPMVGILDHATYSNMDQAHEQLYMDTLGPWLQQLSEEMELQLLPDFGASQQIYIEFNIAAKLAGSFEEQASVLQTAVGAPYMLRNEARARLNLPEIDGGSELVTPLNVLIGGQASPTDSAPPPNPLVPPKFAVRPRFKVRPDTEHVDRITATMSAYFERQHSVIASRLGSKADSPPVMDLERWDAELTGDLFKVAGPVTAAVARKVLAQLRLDEASYDEDMTQNWLHEFASRAAGGINATTETAVSDLIARGGDILGAVKDLFGTYAESRAEQIGTSTATSLAGFGSEEAVRQTGNEGTKTWTVTASNPRDSCEAMNGETVAVGETFSNGALWPGDSSLDVAERARCTCELAMAIN